MAGGLSLFLAVKLSSLNSKSKSVTSDLTAAEERVEQLANDLAQANTENERQSGELEQAQQLNESLSGELAESRAENQRISNELMKSRAENERLSGELTEARAENRRLSNELEEARAQNEALVEENENLVENLNRVIESNENALWLFYLSRIVFQVCITVLNEELQRFKHLQENYDDFADRVAAATRQRRVRRGVTALLGFIPGGNLLGLLGDFLDVVGDAVDVVDVVGDASDIPGLGDLEVDSEDPTLLNISAGSARNLLGISAEQHPLEDLDEVDSDLLNTLIKNAIKRFLERIKPPTPAERRERITHIIVNFEEFGIKYYRSEDVGGRPRTGSSSDSRKKG